MVRLKGGLFSHTLFCRNIRGLQGAKKHPVVNRVNINRIMGLTSTDISHEPGGPKSNCQELGGSTSDCIMIIPKEIFQKSNRQELVGSTSRRLAFVLKKIRHIITQNNFEAPFISNTYESYTKKNNNSLHRKYVDTAKIYRHQKVIKTSSYTAIRI